MKPIIRLYLILSQILLGAMGLSLFFNPHLLLGDNSYLIGVHFLAMILGCAFLGFAVPTLIAAVRGHVQAVKYLLGGALILHAPMPMLFTYNIGAFDYAYETTGQTVATWMLAWIAVFGAPTLFSFLFLEQRD